MIFPLRNSLALLFSLLFLRLLSEIFSIIPLFTGLPLARIFHSPVQDTPLTSATFKFGETALIY